jgi:hypothetical protein
MSSEIMIIEMVKKINKIKMRIIIIKIMDAYNSIDLRKIIKILITKKSKTG